MNALVPTWLEGPGLVPGAPVPREARGSRGAASGIHGWKGEARRSLRSLRMKVLAPILLGLVAASYVHAQSPQPWAGRGAKPRDAATPAPTGDAAEGRAEAVTM